MRNEGNSQSLQADSNDANKQDLALQADSNDANKQDLATSDNGQLTLPVTQTMSEDPVDDSHTPDSGMATDNSMDEKLDEPELQSSPSVDRHNCSDLDVEAHDEQEPVFDEDRTGNEEAAFGEVETVNSHIRSPSGTVEVKPFEQQAHFSLPPAAVGSPNGTMKESAATELDENEPNSSESYDGQTHGVLSPVPRPPPLPNMKTNQSSKRAQPSDNFQKLVSVLERSQTGINVDHVMKVSLDMVNIQ